MQVATTTKMSEQTSMFAIQSATVAVVGACCCPLQKPQREDERKFTHAYIQYAGTDKWQQQM